MRTFAYFDTGHEFPEEIVAAAGFAPYKILGDVDVGTGPADEYLFSFFCPFARSCMAEALENSAQWAGIGFAHGCDATNRHLDVWKTHVKTPFLYWVNTPMKIDGPAKQFYTRELGRFVSALNRQYDIEISQSDLADAVAQSNAIKALMRKMAALRAEKDITNLEYLQMTRMAVQRPKDEVLSAFEIMLADWQARPPFPGDRAPVLLTGSDVTADGWMETLEKAGLRVVRDDLSLGERYFARQIPDNADPLCAIVEYNFRIPQPATRVPADSRMTYLSRILEETKVAGVVSQNLKFCEPYAHDAVWTVPAIQGKRFKVIHLEREYTPKMDQQLLTRLEAYRELL